MTARLTAMWIVLAGQAVAAGAQGEIRIDEAIRMAGSLVLKQRVTRKDVAVRVQSAGSNKDVGVPQRRLDRFRFDRGLDGTGCEIQPQRDHVDLCPLASRMERAWRAGATGSRLPALVAQPDLLLLDVLFSARDAFTRHDRQDHLLDLWADTQPTLILVARDVEEAAVRVDRVLVMRSRPGHLFEVAIFILGAAARAQLAAV